MSEKEICQKQIDFISNLQAISEIIQSNQAEVVFVGGIALRSAMNKPVEFQRSNGTTPDFDLLGLGPNPDVIKKTKDEIKCYRQSSPNCPPVGLESIIFSDHPRQHHSPFEFLSGDRRNDNGEHFLAFRDVDQQIDSQTMTIISRNYGGVKITTLPQETILKRYETRMGGYIKPKDITKIEEFCQYIEVNGGDHLDPKLYQSYTEFCQKVGQKYPHIISISKNYWKLDQKIGGKISGSNGLFYKMIDLFHR